MSQEEASAVTPDVHVDVHVHVHVHVGVVVGVGDDMFFTSSVVCHVILCARSVEGNRAVVRNRKRRWESKGGREGGRGNGGEEKKAEIMRNFRKSTRPGKTTKEQQAEASRRTSVTTPERTKTRIEFERQNFTTACNSNIKSFYKASASTSDLRKGVF